MKYVFLFCLFIFTTNTFSQNKKLKNIYSDNNRIGIGTKYPAVFIENKGSGSKIYAKNFTETVIAKVLLFEKIQLSPTTQSCAI